MRRRIAPRRIAKCLASTVALTVLAGCGGGGGGGGGIASGGGPVSNLAPKVSPAVYLTPEFHNNYGLGAIKAEYAYAAGASGLGVTVAVIDSGIDVDHPEFAGRISSASADLFPGRAPPNVDDVLGHGTAVSGVIGAAKNDIGTHGVAFNSTILAVRADGPGGFFTYTDLTTAMNYAVSKGANVINLSLAGPPPVDPAFAAAVASAVAQGRIVVIASGNDGDPTPMCPACLAGTPSGGNLVVAVGAVDQLNNDSGFHNRAGASANYFLVAPGVGVLTTGMGGGMVSASGTSFAAPHVAGAAAVMLQLFPTLTPAQVVNLLLTTATDLGAPGIDNIFGRGLLNLQAAVGPAGTLEVPTGDTVSGARVNAALTELRLGPAFGDGLRHRAGWGAAIALDAYDRPYAFDLRQRVAKTAAPLDLAARLRDSSRRIELPAPSGASLALTVSDVDGAPLAGAPRLQQYEYAIDLTPALRLRASDEARVLNAAGSLATARAAFPLTGELFSPTANLLGKGHGVAVAQDIGAASTLSLGWLQAGLRQPDAGEPPLLPGVERADLAPPSPLPGGDGRLWMAGIAHRFENNAAIDLKWSFVDEGQDALGGSGGGAFDLGGGARSNFAGVSLTLPLSRGVDWFGGYTYGITAMPAAASGLLRDWDRVETDSFAVGLLARDVFARHDQVGVLFGQPLRVRHARATLAAPVARDLGDRVIVEHSRLDLGPSGRERDFALSYRRELAPGVEFSSDGLWRLQPGHDAGARGDLSLLLGLRVRF
jgi:Subtilase family